MINGFFYALLYFAILPLIVFSIAGFDVSFIEPSDYFTKKYSLNISSAYLIIDILVLSLLLFKFQRKNQFLLKIGSAANELSTLRSKSFLLLLLTLFTYLEIFYNFLIIDHDLHWHSREEFSILPTSVAYYLNPLSRIVTYLAIINIASAFSSFISFETSNFKLNKRNVCWLTIDLAAILMLIYNSGNRWYFALLAALVFYLASSSLKKKMLLISPFFLMAGIYISIFVLSTRVGADFESLIYSTFGSLSFFEQVLSSLLLVTEGISLGANLEISGMALMNPDPLYFLERVLMIPFPGFLIDKPPNFNILAATLIYGVSDGHSLSTGILTSFIIGFGPFAILLSILFIFMIRNLDKKFFNQSALVHLLAFSFMFAAFRFNIEDFIIHLIYGVFFTAVFFRPTHLR